MSLGEDTLAQQLAVNTGSGLVNVLEGTDHSLTVIEMAGYENLSLLPAGKAPDYPARVARSSLVPEVLNAAKTVFDVLVVDLPAINSKNVLPIAQHLDAIVLVIHAGVTPEETVTNALEQMDQSKVLGIVLNRVTGRMTS
jgi:Mrp family chromosome partitioning ATPase